MARTECERLRRGRRRYAGVKDHPAVKRRYDRDCCEARSSGEPRFTNLASSIEHALQMLRSGVNLAGQYDSEQQHEFGGHQISSLSITLWSMKLSRCTLNAAAHLTMPHWTVHRARGAMLPTSANFQRLGADTDVQISNFVAAPPEVRVKRVAS
jgi:hypothetical protein